MAVGYYGIEKLYQAFFFLTRPFLVAMSVCCQKLLVILIVREDTKKKKLGSSLKSHGFREPACTFKGPTYNPYTHIYIYRILHYPPLKVSRSLDNYMFHHM